MCVNAFDADGGLRSVDNKSIASRILESDRLELVLVGWAAGAMTDAQFLLAMQRLRDRAVSQESPVTPDDPCARPGTYGTPSDDVDGFGCMYERPESWGIGA